MCGIAGVLAAPSTRPLDADVVRAMTDALAHRGPDDAGLHCTDRVGLGHRRLSIIDLGGGHQPLYNEDGTVAVVFNGEIYNFRALRRRLQEMGHAFATHSDTEVIVHAWEQWGTACVEQFAGMFAFAIWDEIQARLFLARDPLGIKPLYYGWTRRGDLVFGSELKALTTHPELVRALEPRAIESFLAYGFVPDPQTVLAGVHKLEPGHWLSAEAADPAAATVTRYWDVPYGDAPHAADADALAAELRQRLGDVVGEQLVADVPLGAFLSGGIDSSAVVAMMAGRMDRAVTTCSIAFDRAAFDESAFAERVARHFGTDHHVDTVSIDDVGLIDRLAAAYDEPFADSTAIPTWRLCERSRQRVKVALSGDGGDELFAGYTWYTGFRRNARIRHWLGRPGRALMRAADAVLPAERSLTGRGRLRRLVHKLALDTVDSFARAAMVTSRAERARLYTRAFRERLDGYDAIEVLRGHARRAPTRHPLSLAQYLDTKVYLPGDILTKVDRASMAHGLEVRVPLLDHRFVGWAARIPPDLHLRGGQTKRFFKRALAPLLPHAILHRPKRGFSVPLAEWFRGPLAERARRLATDSHLVTRGIVEADAVRILADEHRRGERDHAALLWALTMADATLSRLLAPEPVAAAAEVEDSRVERVAEQRYR